MSKTITIDGAIYLDTWWLNTIGEPRYLFYEGDQRDINDRAPVVPHSITFELPDDFDPREPQIRQLEAKRQKLRAEFEAALTEIAARISKLTAIGYEETTQ